MPRSPPTATRGPNRRTPANVLVPPPNTTAPVAASHAWILFVPSAPAVHTIASAPWGMSISITHPPPTFIVAFHSACSARLDLDLSHK
jgi:hypothetical protein